MPIVITPTNKGRDDMGGGGMDIAKTPMKKKKVVMKKEAVGQYADPIYDLLDELDIKDNIVLDELIRYMSGDQIEDFVADFRRNHDMTAPMDEDEVMQNDDMQELQKLAGLDEGKVKALLMDMEEDAVDMSKEEFIAKYGEYNVDVWNDVQKQKAEMGEDAVEEDCGCEEETVDEDTVNIPVRELQDLMKLAGLKIEEYANEPEEEYMDSEEQLIGLSGGLNRPKVMHPTVAGGDNPMAVKPIKVDETEAMSKKYLDFLKEEESQLAERGRKGGFSGAGNSIDGRNIAKPKIPSPQLSKMSGGPKPTPKSKQGAFMGGGTTKAAFEDKEEVKELYGIASKTIRKMPPKKPMRDIPPMKKPDMPVIKDPTKKGFRKMGEKEDIIGDIIDKGYTDKTLPKKYRAKPQPKMSPSPKPDMPPVQKPKTPTVGRVKLPKQLSV